MKCENCGFENNDKAKFCTRCGESLANQRKISTTQQQNGNNTKYLIVGLTAIIIILICVIGYFAINLNDNSSYQVTDYSSNDSVNSASSGSTSTTESGEWKLIGSYSGSGSGSQAVSVPAGKIASTASMASFPFLIVPVTVEPRCITQE